MMMLCLFVSFLFTTTCEAQTKTNTQTETHTLLTKIEETKLGYGEWDKVSVMLPNASYKIAKVVYQDNQLVVLFNYTSKEENKPRPYVFYLSDYKIDYKKVGENDAVYVLARHEDELGDFRCPPKCDNAQSSRTSNFRCPPECPF